MSDSSTPTPSRRNYLDDPRTVSLNGRHYLFFEDDGGIAFREHGTGNLVRYIESGDIIEYEIAQCLRSFANTSRSETKASEDSQDGQRYRLLRTKHCGRIGLGEGKEECWLDLDPRDLDLALDAAAPQANIVQVLPLKPQPETITTSTHGPDFSTEANLHADTVAERHDSSIDDKVSETPRTEAEAKYGTRRTADLIDFARQLERELAAAGECYADLSLQYAKAKDRLASSATTPAIDRNMVIQECWDAISAHMNGIAPSPKRAGLVLAANTLAEMMTHG